MTTSKQPKKNAAVALVVLCQKQPGFSAFVPKHKSFFPSAGAKTAFHQIRNLPSDTTWSISVRSLCVLLPQRVMETGPPAGGGAGGASSLFNGTHSRNLERTAGTKREWGRIETGPQRFIIDGNHPIRTASFLSYEGLPAYRPMLKEAGTGLCYAHIFAHIPAG